MKPYVLLLVGKIFWPTTLLVDVSSYEKRKKMFSILPINSNSKKKFFNFLLIRVVL